MSKDPILAPSVPPDSHNALPAPGAYEAPASKLYTTNLTSSIRCSIQLHFTKIYQLLSLAPLLASLVL
jgi:hypothetical protein